jgi:hypothetical protein
MKKFSMLIWLVVLSLLLMEFARGAGPDGHKPEPCFGCHFETIGASYGKGECDDCHNYGLDVSKLQAEHNPKICVACHMGNTIDNGSEEQIFHSGHNAVNCTTCHVQDNFTVLKIEHNGFQCVSCHGNQVHSIHMKNLARTCPLCHGSWANGRVYQADGSLQSQGKPKESSTLERFTIFNFIKSLFNAILAIR